MSLESVCYALDTFAFVINRLDFKLLRGNDKANSCSVREIFSLVYYQRKENSEQKKTTFIIHIMFVANHS